MPVPRNRSARAATIGSTRQRIVSSSTFSSRSASAFRRRTVAIVLVVVALALLTVYFREASDGSLHEVQGVGASVLRPFEVAADRVARPFEDAAGWFGDVLDAKSENEKLRAELDRLRAQLIVNKAAAHENAILRQQQAFRVGPSFPRDYRGLSTAIIARPFGRFDQQVMVAAGSDDGVRLHDPVVTPDGLVGQVTQVANDVAQVTLLTDESSAVSAVDLKTRASGIVRHGDSSGGSLLLDQVTKDKQVFPGDVVITAGWRSGNLASIYPRWIPIGTVKRVGQLDIDEDKEIQIEPFVDFSSLESVIIEIKKGQR
jgi:rod shape-determining protein MreC